MALKTIFNRVLTVEVFQESWAIGLIKPIYKKGDKNTMKNNKCYIVFLQVVYNSVIMTI